VVPYIGAQLMENLMHKSGSTSFVTKYCIDHPKTFVYRKEMGTIPLSSRSKLPSCQAFQRSPIWEHPFPVQNKVFIAGNRTELEDFLDRFYASGYPDTMIIQDFVPGDDTSMRVIDLLLRPDRAVKLMMPRTFIARGTQPPRLGKPRRDPE
jgi:D-aspartate ligase